MPERSRTTWPISPWLITLVFFLSCIGYLLWTEHRAHVVQFLPWLILLLCPLMHLFMHHGHGGHGGHGGHSGDQAGHDHTEQ